MIDQLVLQIAARLGVAADRVWAALVRQATIDAMYSLIWPVLAIVFFPQVIRWYILVEENDGWTEGRVVKALVGGVVGVVLFFGTLVCLYQQITLHFNPDYAALQQLKDVLK
jgi:hypothetical protein